MNAQEIRDFAAYLSHCTNNQVEYIAEHAQSDEERALAEIERRARVRAGRMCQ